MLLQNWDTDWIYFTRKVRRGIFIMLFLFIAIAVFPRIYYRYIYTLPSYDIKVSALINDDIKNSSESKLADKDINVEKSVESKYKAPDEMFDPNTYTVQNWVEVGLSDKQAASILNYINKGGKIKVKSDLKKMYVINDELYNILEPKINLPETIKEDFSGKFEKDEIYIDNNLKLQPDTENSTEISRLSINKATSEELQKIKGIGPFFAGEIIRIREEYGGFISAEQLLDIYKMDEEKLGEIIPFLIINPNEVNKININTADLEQLRQHPLITIDMAKSIVYFRENYQPYTKLDELLLSPYIDSKTLKKLTPYLTVGS